MNPNKGLNQVLAHIPQLEDPDLSYMQERILNFLKEQRKPTIAKTISARLQIDYNTTRARLSELMSMGFICQPNKDKAEQSIPGRRVCGYSIVKLG